MEPWGAAKKTLLVRRCQQLLSGFLAEGYFPRVSRQSRDNEIISGAVQRSPGIYFTTEENPGKPQLGDRQ